MKIRISVKGVGHGEGLREAVFFLQIDRVELCMQESNMEDKNIVSFSKQAEKYQVPFLIAVHT